MTEMDIRASETGMVRVFHLDLPGEAVERFTAQAGTGEWPLQYALGADRLKASFVDVVSIRDLGDMRLSEYLAEAYAVSGTDFQAAKPQIDTLRGHAVVLPSRAFDGVPQKLRISSPLRWVGTFAEARSTPKGAPLRAKSAEGSAAAETDVVSMPKGGSPLLRALVIVVTALTLGVLLYAFSS